MQKQFKAPESVEELRDQLIEIWESLGAEFDERALDQIRRNWLTNREPGDGLHKNVRPLVAERALATDYPELTAAIAPLLDTEEARNVSSVLYPMLGYFLDGAELLQTPLAEIQARAWPPYNAVHYFMPRDEGERERMIAVFPKLKSVALQRRLLLDLKRNLKEDEINDLWEKLLPVLPAGFFNLEDEDRERRELSYKIISGTKNHSLLEHFSRHGDAYTRKFALYLYGDARYENPDWQPVMDLVKAHPEAFMDKDMYLMGPTVALLECLWERASGNPEFSSSLIGHAFRLVHNCYEGGNKQDTPRECVTLLLRMLDERPREPRSNDHYPNYDEIRHLGKKALLALWETQHPVLLNEYPIALCYRFSAGSYDSTDRAENRVYKSLAPLIKELILRDSKRFTEFDMDMVSRQLPLINDDELARSTSEYLKPLGAKSKVVQRELPKGLCQISPAVLNELGWLDDKRKGVRLIGLESLLASTNPDAGPFLRQVHDDKKTSDADRDRVIKHIKKLGLGTKGLASTAELSEDAVKQKAAKTKIKPAVEKLWSNTLAERFEPLKPGVARWLMNLVFESKETGLPKAAVTALKELPPENQARLAEHMVHLWLSNNGDSKLRWLTKFVLGMADDRIVEPLIGVFKSWHKRAKPKAVFALQTLGALNTQFALSFVHEVYSKGMYSDSIHEGAEKVLKAAARRRKLNLPDFFDELTPDFGLGPDGLILDVGPFNYIVKVATDLSLQVKNEKTGKTTKSLPKAGATEEAHKRAAAQSQFNLLRTSLKKVAKQQGQRLQEAMICERSWPAERWRVLFLDHHLLGVMGQGLIWQTGKGKSFRISEDSSLLTPDDETLALSESDEVKLWHPVHAAVDEIHGWSQHLNDYEIKPFIDQVGQSRLTFTDEEIKTGKIARFDGIEVEQFLVRRMLEGWNYQISGQDGSTIFSFERYFSSAGVYVEFCVDRIDVFAMKGDTTKFTDLIVRDKEYKAKRLREVPQALVATVLGQGEALRAKASS